MTKRKSVLRFLPLTAMLLFLAGCGEDRLTALDPYGPAAQWIYDNMILSLYVMALVVIAVFTLFFIAVVKFRRKPGDDELPKQVEGSKALEVTWTVIPILLLIILAVPTVQGTYFFAEEPPSVGASGEGEEEDVQPEEIIIDVTAHQYWWQFDYPEGFTAGNEVYIPTGEKVWFNLTAGDVMHSFWVPALGGKLDNVPGIESMVWLQADEPGVYYGKCAELCGPSHALMEFKVVALEQDEYDEWVAAMQEEEVLPEENTIEADGRQVFEDQGCIGCHAVEGQGGAQGPTLTNFADRERIAGVFEFNDETLESWIRNPEEMKQDNNMPSYESLSDEDMEALIAYLNSLSVEEKMN